MARVLGSISGARRGYHISLTSNQKSLKISWGGAPECLEDSPTTGRPQKIILRKLLRYPERYRTKETLPHQRNATAPKQTLPHQSQNATAPKICYRTKIMLPHQIYATAPKLCYRTKTSSGLSRFPEFSVMCPALPSATR